MSPQFLAQRRFHRYQVEAIPDQVLGVVADAKVPLKLLTLGLGGCAFQAWEIDQNLIPPSKIKCQFELSDGSSKVIRGELIYLRPRAVGTTPLYMYGVQFDADERVILAPLVRELEIRAQQGLLARS